MGPCMPQREYFKAAFLHVELHTALRCQILRGYGSPRVRFKRPYAYTMEAPGLAGQVLTIKQAPFSDEGFASTGDAATTLRLP